MASTPLPISPCCLKATTWEGTPTGRTDKLLGTTDTYIAGTNPDVCILLIPDIFGWTAPNIRLLADHFATEANATVYVPDIFDGEVLPLDILYTSKWEEIDLQGFLARNSREIREPLILDLARELRGRYKTVAAVGYCYGGWAVFRLGVAEHNNNNRPLVDCISAGHPSWLTKEDIDNVAVPVQMLAPEVDLMYPEEMKRYTFEVLQEKKVAFDYQHFPGVEHSCLCRGDAEKAGEREAMVRGKHAVVAWVRQFATRS